MLFYSFTTRCLCLFSLLLTTVLFGCSAGEAPGKAADRRERAAKEIPVTAITVQSKEFRRNVEAVGSLFPQKKLPVSSEVEEKVDQVFVEWGARGQAGQPMVGVSPVELKPPLDHQRPLYRQAGAVSAFPKIPTTI